MKYEFEALDAFIDSFTTLHQKTPLSENVPDFETKKTFLEQEVARLRTLFITHLFSENESHLEPFVQHHQTRLIELVDAISKCTDVNAVRANPGVTEGETKHDMCMLAFKKLEVLLTFIEIYLHKYFDLDQKIPETYRLLEQGSLSELAAEVRKYGVKRRVDSRLIDLALAPLDDFIKKDSEKNVSYRRLIYLKGLLDELVTLLKKDSVADLQFELIQQLVHLNLNSYHFLVYVTDKIRSETQGQPTVLDQLDRLNYWLKLNDQFLVKLNTALSRDMPTIKDQLAGWLQAEISYLEKKSN